jgi:hypothetical protein
MTLKKIREKARTVGVKNYSRYRKSDLIRAIQAREGNSACFGSIRDCWEFGCLWREECQD